MNDKLKVIAISGKARHGKDTFGELLSDELKNRGRRVLVTHYGDLVKYVCKTFFNWDGNKDEKGRTILQYVGTDVVRKQNSNYWVDFIIGIIKMFGSNWDYVLIPDTRFPNEVDRLTEQGLNVTYVRVERPDFDNGLTDEQKNHPSETAMDHYDHHSKIEVHNGGTMEDLKNSAVILADYLIGDEYA